MVRTHRDERATAIEAARFLQLRNLSSTILVTNLRDGAVVPFARDPDR